MMLIELYGNLKATYDPNDEQNKIWKTIPLIKLPITNKDYDMFFCGMFFWSTLGQFYHSWFTKVNLNSLTNRHFTNIKLIFRAKKI